MTTIVSHTVFALLILGLVVACSNDVYIVDPASSEVIVDSLSDCTLELVGHWTSSGATREFSSTIEFVDNVAVSGSLRYYHASGSYPFGSDTENCVLKGSEWVGKSLEDDCDNYGWIPLSKDVLDANISSGRFLPFDDCSHYDTYYKIS